MTGDVDLESAPYWAALVEHRLVLQRCGSCSRHRFPPMPSCPWCGTTDTDVVEARGQGTVYSWVTVRRPFGDAWAGEVPYIIAAVELDEGCRVFARVDVDADDVAAGLRLDARYVDHDGWSELRFAPSAP